MKLLFFSDSHGCAGALRELSKRIAEFAPDRILFLGDSLYHGPRNAIQGDYDPNEASALLNAMEKQIIAVRGNCDAEVDQMMLRFPLLETSTTVLAGNQSFFLSHGHVFGPGHIPSIPQETILATGHTHVPVIERLPTGHLHLNPGSISIPKGGSIPSYATFDGTTLALRDLYTGKTYRELTV